jgi:HEPN domain-containing protein
MKTDESSPQDWFNLAHERLHVSDIAYSADGYASMTTMELLHEAAERYLKGWLVALGWSLIKTHDLSRLVHEAELLEPRFATFAEYADDLTQAFVQSHYPGGDPDLVGQDYPGLRRKTAELLDLMRQTLPQFQI